jgi:hypothetical protein
MRFGFFLKIIRRISGADPSVLLLDYSSDDDDDDSGRPEVIIIEDSDDDGVEKAAGMVTMRKLEGDPNIDASSDED